MNGTVENILGVLAAIAGFALILYLAFITTRLIGKRYGTGTRGGKNLKLLESLPLGQDKYLMIARAGDRTMLLGVTAQKIELLTELDESTLELSASDDVPPTFAQVLKQNIGLGSKPPQEKPKEASTDEKKSENE